MDVNQFERLIQAIMKETFGHQPPAFGVGVGVDRESTYHARIAWSSSPGERVWDGETGVQIYFRPRASGTGDADWFFRTVKAMLDRWQKRVQGKKGSSFPGYGYLLLITNARISNAQRAAEGSLIQAALMDTSVKDFIIWDLEDLIGLLDGVQEVRREFSGFVTPAAALPRLYEYFDDVSRELNDMIIGDVATELMSDQWVRLTQAGDPTHEKLALSKVAIDLPLLSENFNTETQAANYIVREGNRVLRLGEVSENHRHIVLLGGPGQGKTTIVQLVCQVYREAMLRDASWIGPDTGNLLKSVRSGFKRMSISTPIYWRWPIRIELSAFADAASGPSRTSLLRYVAEKISSRTPREINAAQLRPWLKSFPWLLVLDGLDEVASSDARGTVMGCISEFLIQAAEDNADIFVVVTTRPQGYIGEFNPVRYNHLTLASLTPEQASVYAKRLAEVRHADDPDMRRKLINRTQIAAAEDSTARLMRTPLQVTIMSLLLEGRERVPQARYTLFEAYYDTIYAREAAKPGPLGKLLEEQRSHINALHDRIGFLLQVQAEKTGGADALLPQAELHELATIRLEAEGYKATLARALADEIVSALTNRLVLIVPKAIDDVGFEVRSIQEFMAARAIVSGTDDSVISRLRVTAPATHWRNTWLLAAGRLFSSREHMRLDLVELLAEVDIAGILHVIVAPGADLALDLLDDDIATSNPMLQRKLAVHALTLLHHPPDQDLKRRALVMFRYASHDFAIRAAAEKAIDQALRASPARAKTARIVGQAWRSQKGMLSDIAHSLLTRPVSRYPIARNINIADLVHPSVNHAKLNDLERVKLEDLLAEFQKVKVLSEDADISDATVLATRQTGIRDVIDRDVIDECLSYPSVVEVVATAANGVAMKTWVGAAELRNLLRAWLQRRPVSEEVLMITPFP